MWNKIKSFCLHSATIAWQYAIIFFSGVLEYADSIAEALGDPQLKDQLHSVFGNDAKLWGKILLGISIVSILARLRTIQPKA